MGRKLDDITIGEIKKNPEKYKSVIQQIKFPFELIQNFKKLTESFQILADSISKSFKSLENKNPWFIENDWYLSEKWWGDYLIEETFTSNPLKLEKELIIRFDKELKPTKEELINYNPKRKQIIEEIFKLYKQRCYHGVVSLSYSQTDGICKEKFKIPFWGGFKNTDKKTNSQRLIEELPQEYFIGFNNLRLNHRGEMNLKSEEIFESNTISKTNNRHHVLHGSSYMYGTKINAVKSILLMDYISSLKLNK